MLVELLKGLHALLLIHEAAARRHASLGAVLLFLFLGVLHLLLEFLYVGWHLAEALVLKDRWGKRWHVGGLLLIGEASHVLLVLNGSLCGVLCHVLTGGPAKGDNAVA